MRRHLYNVGVAMSLVLFLVTVVLTVYSYFVGEAFRSGSRISELEAVAREVMVSRGVVSITWDRVEAHADQGRAHDFLLFISKGMPPRASFSYPPRIYTTFGLGFGWRHSHIQAPSIE